MTPFDLPCARLSGAVGGFAIAAALAAPVLAQDALPALVKVDQVRQEPVSQTVPVIGRLAARQSGAVAARVAGAVAEIRVDVGDRVEAGDVLAVLATDRLEAERSVLEAAVRVAGTKIRTAREEVTLFRQELDRLKNLRKSPAFSQARFDDKRQEVAMAEGELAEAQAELAREEARLAVAEIDLKHSRIVAPFPGVVTERHTAAGNFLGVGDKVVTLINDQDLEIEAEVPATRIAGLQPGREIEVELQPERRHRGVVRAVLPEENPLTRTRLVRFTPRFGETLEPLAANQSVTVLVPIGSGRQVVSVHKDAVINRRGKQIVFVVEENAAQVRALRLGQTVGGRFEVLDGLSPGDLVVVRGNERLQAGQKVRYEGSS
ncbi:MAG: efflux RND transporter periplasmic adaptor subunit [Kiloniellales bacterium]